MSELQVISSRIGEAHRVTNSLAERLAVSAVCRLLRSRRIPEVVGAVARGVPVVLERHPARLLRALGRVEDWPRQSAMTRIRYPKTVSDSRSQAVAYEGLSRELIIGAVGSDATFRQHHIPEIERLCRLSPTYGSLDQLTEGGFDVEAHDEDEPFAVVRGTHAPLAVLILPVGNVDDGGGFDSFAGRLNTHLATSNEL